MICNSYYKLAFDQTNSKQKQVYGIIFSSKLFVIS